MKKLTAIILALFLCLTLTCCAPTTSLPDNSIESVNSLPEFSSEPFIILNGNQPEFDESDLKPSSFEEYSSLDSLGRCSVAYACISTDLMPTEERGSIGQVKPSGWHTVKYDIVDGKYLYNRCHLIGFQLTGENANEQNLITGTRYMNVEGMLPFENMVADYIKETENHVLYRVTPVFEGDNLVASGVIIEAKSVEDGGEGICFNVYVYNSQPGISIDYATGESWLAGHESVSSSSAQSKTEYILNTNSKKFHKTDCSGAESIKPENKSVFSGDRSKLLDDGYSPCKQCNP